MVALRIWTAVSKNGMSRDLDGSRFCAFGCWDEERKHAVAVLRLYAVRIDFHRKRQRPIELARNSLATVDADTLVVANGFLASDADCVLFGLNFQVAFTDAW